MKCTQFYPVILTGNVAGTARFYRDHFRFQPSFESDWYVHLQSQEDDKVNIAVLHGDHETIPETGRGRVSGRFFRCVESLGEAQVRGAGPQSLLLALVRYPAVQVDDLKRRVNSTVRFRIAFRVKFRCPQEDAAPGGSVQFFPHDVALSHAAQIRHEAEDIVIGHGDVVRVRDGQRETGAL